VGYAGGINPDNAAEVVSRIQADRYWIDMETGVRTGDWLDLDKCEAVCRAVYGG
jgi:phosphoribosylanthranilate isomerase